MNLKIGLATGVALASAVFGAQPASADIVYMVDRTVGTGSVIGTITTDGVIGTVNPSDIVGWRLVLTGTTPPGVTDTIDSTESAAATWGDPWGDLTATAHELLFNFSGPTADAIFQIHESSGTQYYCLQAGSTACYQGESDVPQAYYDSSAQIVARTGEQVIGVAVPEASTWALLLAGFAGLGLAGYRRARRLVVAA